MSARIVGLSAAGVLLVALAAWTIGLSWFNRAQSEPAADVTSVADPAAVPATSKSMPVAQIQPSSDAAKSNSTTPTVLPRTELNIPTRYQFSGNDRLRIAEDFDTLLARYTNDEVAIIRQNYASYGKGADCESKYCMAHVFSFHTEEQLAWLVENGYPTPDDVLAAVRMSDDELAALANRGNYKARVFWFERVSEQLRRGTELSTGYSTHPEYTRASMEAMWLEDKILGDGSPFGGFAVARFAADHNHFGKVAGAYTFAAWLGDVRGDDFAHQFVQFHPELDLLEPLSGFIVVQLSAANGNPTGMAGIYLAQRRPPFPRYPER